jgi:hypothetical protein
LLGFLFELFNFGAWGDAHGWSSEGERFYGLMDKSIDGRE